MITNVWSLTCDHTDPTCPGIFCTSTLTASQVARVYDGVLRYGWTDLGDNQHLCPQHAPAETSAEGATNA